MKIQQEDYIQCEEELVLLGAMHYREIAVLPYEYEPDLELFRQLNNLGMIFVITVRDDLGELVGYSLNTLSKHMIFKDNKQSHCNLLYMQPEYRGATPLRLIKETEQVAEALGANMHSWDVPARNDFSPVLLRKGYKKIESCYSKCLGG